MATFKNKGVISVSIVGSFTEKIVNEVALHGANILPSVNTTLLARIAINETSAASAVGADGVAEVYTDIDFNVTTKLEKEHTLYSRSNELQSTAAGGYANNKENNDKFLYIIHIILYISIYILKASSESLCVQLARINNRELQCDFHLRCSQI